MFIINPISSTCIYITKMATTLQLTRHKGLKALEAFWLNIHHHLLKYIHHSWKSDVNRPERSIVIKQNLTFWPLISRPIWNRASSQINRVHLLTHIHHSWKFYINRPEHSRVNNQNSEFLPLISRPFWIGQYHITIELIQNGRHIRGQRSNFDVCLIQER